MKMKLTIAAILFLAGCSSQTAQAPIATTAPIIVSSSAPTPPPASPVADEFPQLLAQIKSLLKSGENLRAKPDCVQEMRKLQPQAAAIRAKTEAAAPDSRIRTLLGAAAIDLNLCVSCSDTVAPPACANVASAIKDAEEAIK